MATRLNTPLPREIDIGDKAYTLQIAASVLKQAEKGRRKCVESCWVDLVSGDAALAAALTASVARI